MNKNKYPLYSITMSVYKNDNPDYFRLALESILNQTVAPNEIVLTIDGPVPDAIESVLQEYSTNEMLNDLRYDSAIISEYVERDERCRNGEDIGDDEFSIICIQK